MTLEADAGTVPVAETPPIAPAQTEAPAPSAPAPESQAPAQPSQRESLEAIWNKHNPQRAADGKFASQTQGSDQPATDESTSETPADETAVETDEPETPDQPKEEAPVEPAPPAIDAPNSWPGEWKAKWNSLPPDMHKFLHERESEAHKQITQQGQAIASFRPFAELLNDHQDAFQRQNVTPIQGIDALLKANAHLERDPPGFVTWLAGQYGLDLAQLAEAAATQTQPDPEVLALKQKLGELESTMTATQRAQRDATMAAANQTIAEFAKDKPYFDEPGVQPLMGTLLTSGAAKDLSEAYDMAVHANSDLRQRILADQRKGEEEKRAAEDAKRKQEEAAEAKRKKAEAEKAAAEARKAAAVNVRSGAGASPTAPKDIRETLATVADKHFG